MGGIVEFYLGDRLFCDKVVVSETTIGIFNTKRDVSHCLTVSFISLRWVAQPVQDSG